MIVREYSWSSVAEMRESGLEGDLRPRDPSRFRASMRMIVLDGVRIELFRAEPYQHVRPAAPGGTEVGTAAMGGGRVLLRFGDREVEASGGDVVVTDFREPATYEFLEPVRILRTTIQPSLLPPDVLHADLLPISVLHRTPLVEGYIAFLSVLIGRRPDGEAGDETQLTRTLRDLQVAAFREARPTPTPTQPRNLAVRAERYVADHLADPDLDPPAVADALGISLRFLHQVFNTDGRTVAAYIRNRRLDSVAEDLRSELRTSATDLAERYGFSGRDHLARAFRRRFGTTMADYQAGAKG